MTDNPFMVGDIIQKKAGNAPMIVTHVRGDHVWAEYQHTSRWKSCGVPYHYFKFPNSPKEDHMSTIYQTQDGRYGTLLTKDSQGRFILEIKGTDVVAPFDPATLQEVIPHTVQIRFEAGGTHHYEIAEGKLKEGDAVIMGLNFGRVLKVNTRNKTPRQIDGPLARVLTEEIS